MTSAQWSMAAAMLMPHVVAIALCSARLFPISLLCPALGGTAVPSHVRLSLVLSLACGIHFAGGIHAPAQVFDVAFFGAVLRELCLGTAMGLISALPFDAARMGGRFIDLFRGTSAEAVLPITGTREAVSGDLLHHLLVSMASCGAVFPLVLGSIVRSFGVVSLGAFVPTESAVMVVARFATAAMGTGLAVGAPVAAAAMAIDLVLGYASRLAPQLGAHTLAAPAKVLAGGAMLWLGLGIIGDRLLAGVVGAQGTLVALLHVAP